MGGGSAVTEGSGDTWFPQENQMGLFESCHGLSGNLVSSCFRNNMPSTRWLKQQKFSSHGAADWDVQDQGVSRLDSR